MTMRIVVGVLVTAILVVPFVLVGAGLWLLAQRQFGDKVQAEVISCDIDVGYKTSQQTCLARWTQDGVEHTGSIQGSGDDEVGKTITATVHGDELYSRSLGLPLILLGLGLPLCFFPFAWLRSRLERRSSGPQ
jgi:hypothetical protein